MLEAVNLTKKYGTFSAVHNLSFSAEKGTVLGFLGPNGAGKSTTMNMLTGYIAATEGNVLVNGISMLDEPERAKKQIGYLPEIPPVYPDMTVNEYLDFVTGLKKANLKTAKETEAMLEDIRQKTGISEVAGKLIKTLSKGYRQRVGLAAALIGYPEVLILDEPTVGLDPKQIIEIRDLIRELSKDHLVILSSHILSEVSAVCDRIMIINKGELVAEGTAEELIRKVGENTKVIIEVGREDAERTEQILEGFEGVASYEQKTTAEEGTVSYTINEEAGFDIRKELFFRMAAENIALFKLLRPTKSLEDIFIEITGGEDK